MNLSPGRKRAAMSSAAALAILMTALIGVLGISYFDTSQGLGAQVNSLQSQVSSMQGRQADGSANGQGGTWAEETCPTTTGSTRVTLVAEKATVEIAKGVSYDGWSFNGTVPGPTIWVRQCELVHFTLINNDTMPHSIDFHAAQVNWATVYAPVAPGDSLSFDFVPAYPGIFMYHCGVPPVLEHIANGMYGVIVVNGTGSQALPRAPGGEYVIIESEFYLNSQPNADGSFGGNYTKMLAATPDYVVFNGEEFRYMTSPLVVKPNELVRLYVFNEGPSIWEAFHVIGGIMDTVYVDGNPFNAQHGLQTVSVPPAGGAIVDMYFPDAGGKNLFVNHAFAYAQKGAIGMIQVENGTSGISTTTSATQGSPSGAAVSIVQGSAANTTSVYYSPQVLTVVVGVNNTVTWTNDDQAPHTVTATDGSFNSGNLNAGQAWSYTFTKAGVYTYFCSYHPWMKGTIIVKAG